MFLSEGPMMDTSVFDLVWQSNELRTETKRVSFFSLS